MTPAPPPRAVRLADRLPQWVGSIRFRLTLLYSVMLFGLAAIVVGMIYLGLSRSLDDQPVSRQESVLGIFQTPEGPVIARSEREVPDYLALFEREVNTRAMEQLREYSFLALGALFVASLAIGWYVAGMVLRPIGRITAVARDIQATDLSRRIHLRGPNDELKQLADTFDDMLGRLDEAFEGQRRFIHEASHELRNPLAVIRTNLDVTLDDPDVSSDELREMAAVVGRSAERMSTLVEDLLTYARSGEITERSELVDLADVVDATVAEFRAAAEARSLTLVGRSAHGVAVHADRDALRRATANLVANATRLAPEHTTVAVEAVRRDGWALLTVSDEGPGIAPDDQPLVFERFWRGRDQPTGNGRSGLGLTIVRQIAEAHHGHVDLVSAPGQGSVFTVWLPAAASEPVVADVTTGDDRGDHDDPEGLTGALPSPP